MRIRSLYLKIAPRSCAEGKKLSFEASEFDIRWDADMQCFIINNKTMIPMSNVNEIVLHPELPPEVKEKMVEAKLKGKKNV